MKSVLLNNDGYTVDGQWRLVKIPTPTTAAEDDFKRMIAKSPAPELGEAVLSHYVNNDNGEVIPAEDFYDLPVSVWTPLFKAPPAPAVPEKRISELESANQALRAELDRVKQKAMVDYDEYIAGNRKDRADAERLAQAIKSEAQYCFHWRDESLKKGDADRAKRHEERGLRLMSHIDAAKGVDRG